MTHAQPDLPADFPKFLEHLCDIAAQETLPRFRAGTAVTDKGAEKGEAFDPVTEADKGAERALRVAIETAFPDHGILGEEEAEKPASGPWRWVLDPVDGTRAFVSGVPVWTTLIGLEHEGTPVGGIISQPVLGEHWVAAPGKGTQLTTKGGTGKAVPSACTRIAEARVAVTDLRPSAYLSAAEAEAVTLIADGARICRMGLDAYGFGLVASGHIDLAIEAGCYWWDASGPAGVVSGSGAIACGWQGDPLREGDARGRMIFAATPALAEEAVARLRDVPL